jgi:glycosyltransferase involved in cell wall biosynthesis
MRILHLSPTDTEGGAARGVYQLHQGLKSAGVDSIMLVQRKYSDDPSVFTSAPAGKYYNALYERLDRLPLHFYEWTRQNWWTVGWLPFDLRRAVRQLKPDIIQFHWIGHGAAPIRTLARLREYPIVWTLRDMWTLTGGCHYSDDCEKFLSGCGACPQLGSERGADISRWQWNRKHRAWRDLSIDYVGLSNWIADYARRSPLTVGSRVSVIPNGIDVDRFVPSDMADARARWNLPADRKIILAGALFGSFFGVAERRKGFHYLQEALRMLADRGWRDRATVVIFGADSGDLDTGLDVRYVGRLRHDTELASLYSSADVMVVPSLQESFGKTAAEAMACGTPVTAFANSGLLDIVDHKQSGYLATLNSSADLADGIAWCVDGVSRDGGLRARARQKAVQAFNVPSVVGRYIDLYERILERRRRAADVDAGDEARRHVAA